jgi:predicted unusual protein kinase regulating ubiquinone biosynthesis (AarF/ABC1/UbiB family)
LLIAHDQKLGQILSTRYDILPYDYVKGLERLQDSVPPFDGDLAYQIVTEELGEGRFADFDRTPIAAASLGQVHLAVTAGGERVAVKVQRPGLRDLFDADLANLKILADLLYKLDESPDSMLRDWREIFASNAQIIYEEIDYTKEASHGKKFAENFAGMPWVKVPSVYAGLSSEKVLTMEYVPGIKINNVAELERRGLDRAHLARLSGESFMIQLLRHGFFHCDPHPGNIAVDAKGPGGSARLIYYDFGMVDELSGSFRKALVDGFFALYESRPKAIVQALIDAEVLGGKVDRLAVESIARYFLDNFRQRLALDRAVPMTNEERDEMRMSTMQDIGNELAAVASDKPFRYPRALPYVLRAFNALEGVGKELDPDYDVSRIAKKYITSLIDLRDGSAAITAWKKVQQRLGWRRKDWASVVQSPRRVSQVYETLTKLESGELQLRVRALELERAMVRNSVMQRASLHAIAACCALNVATVLSTTSTAAAGVLRGWLVRCTWVAAAVFGSRALSAIRKLDMLQKGEREGNLNEYVLESKRQAM